MLKSEHIEKIISTYRERRSEDKYSHEIRENDYNLNISRYVDTFEEEEIIDIDALASEIASIDASMHDIDTKIR